MSILSLCGIFQIDGICYKQTNIFSEALKNNIFLYFFQILHKEQLSFVQKMIYSTIKRITKISDSLQLQKLKKRKNDIQHD